MSEEQPLPPQPEQAAPPGLPAVGSGSPRESESPPAETGGATADPAPGHYPVWGYFDVLVVAGIAFAGLLASQVLMAAIAGTLKIPLRPPDVRFVLPGQILLYIVLFSGLAAWLRLQHDEPFWRSLGWKSFRMKPMLVILLGIVSAYGVSILGKLIQTPETPNPMTELMEGRLSLILIAIFGVTFGPLCEELAFRGFLQPLLVRSLGAAPGIIVAAIPFGLLHYREYGNSWRHAVIVAAAGAAFGWVRHVTGSTRASTIMHSAYNSLFFVAFLARGR